MLGILLLRKFDIALICFYCNLDFSNLLQAFSFKSYRTFDLIAIVLQSKVTDQENLKALVDHSALNQLCRVFISF